MVAVTTYNGPRNFSWSYSRLKNFEICPKRHLHCDVLKDAKDDDSEQLLFGNKLHEALAKRISADVPLPMPYDGYEKWAKWALEAGHDLKVEQKLAMREDFSPCGYFDNKVWFRGVIDVARVREPVAAIIDWKTGKIIEDSVQLALFAQMVFSHYPKVQMVRTEFVWLKENATTREDFKRSDMPGFWASMIPRINQLKAADRLQEYPAKPGYLCERYCPVKQCQHNGYRNGER